MIHDGPFGSCCSDLEDAMKTPPNSMFRVDDGTDVPRRSFEKSDTRY